MAPENPTAPRRRILRRVLFGTLAVLGIGAVFLFRPLATDDLVASPNPAATYEEAVARIEQIRREEDKLPLHEEGRTIILSHGHQTERVFVLLHGFTNSPRQFRELGEKLFATGANVIIPRLPQHGFADRLTDALRDFTANELVRHAEEGVNAAHGLGRRVTVVGLSVSGVTAAWLAHEHEGLDEVFLLAPFFGVSFSPGSLTAPLTAALMRLPNTFLWWDPRVRENLQQPPHNYPRYPTHALGDSLRLGLAVERQKGPLQVKRLSVILSASDIAVNNARTLHLLEQWEAASPGIGFFAYTFPASDKVPHDMIDPLQPNARTDVVYPQLLKWLTESP